MTSNASGQRGATRYIPVHHSKAGPSHLGLPFMTGPFRISKGPHHKLLTMQLPQLPYLPLLLFLYVPSLALSAPQAFSRRAVTSSSKAGLAWPNGDKVDMAQFLGTGKVSW